MRGKLSDQDLTNYALNDGMEPRERLYVESMLAVSEECRNDVYQMIDLGQMLEEGFQQEDEKTVPGLTAAQREELLRPRPHRSATALAIFNRAVGALAIAACLAFALVNAQTWHSQGGAGGKIAQMGAQVTELSQRAAGATDDFDFSAFVDFQALSEDSSDWLQAASDVVMQPAAIYSSPSFFDAAADFSEFQ